jgi:plastocyanin domain-containing protein
VKTTKAIWVVAALALAGGVGYVGLRLSLSAHSAAETPAPAASAAIATADGKQGIEIMVKEGYQPREITAKAGVPLILKMKTQGTFDCSTTFTVPKLGIRTQLQPTGEASVEIPAQKAGDSVYGVCGMGMYTLVIKFT